MQQETFFQTFIRRLLANIETIRSRFHKMNVLEWPAQTPDLNPIEHLWIDGKQGVRAANPQNSEELWQAATNTWDNISLPRCRTLIASMKSRCIEIIKNKGGATSY